MQLCSLHHCVLFFLIFTFTIAPVSALVIFPTRAKLHQPVTLSCTSKCSGLLMWNLYNNRGVVLARCDQKSCWAKEGFSISHDHYLKGDSSLTITEADYSKRNLYACECGDSDYALVRLVIETVFTPVQRKYDEDLKLKVSVPEPVEVIYKSGDAADEVICSVTNGSLQCKDDYRHRTSLTYPELTLKHMKPRDSGSYTIRDTKNNEDIQMYAVSVEDEPVPVWRIVLVVILLCFFVGAGMLGTFLLYKRHRRKQLNRRLQQVDQLVQEAEGGTEEKIREVEMSLHQLQQQYNKTEYKDRVKEFCSDKRIQMLKRRLQLVDQLVQEAAEGTVETSLDQLQQQYNNTEYEDKVKVFCSEKRRQLMERQLQQVKKLVQEAEGTEEKIREAEKSLDQLQQHYNNTEYKHTVKVFYREKRRQLLNKQLLPVVQLVLKNEEWKKEYSDKVSRGLNCLKSRFRNTKYANEVTVFCMKQRSQMNWYRLQYSEEEIDNDRRETLNKKLLQVEGLVQKAKEGIKEITEVEKAIDDVELQYSYTEYSEHVLMLCDVKRKQLNPPCSNEDLITPDSELNNKLQHVEELVQQAITDEEISKLELKYYTTVDSERVSLLCMTKRAELFWYRLLHSEQVRAAGIKLLSGGRDGEISDGDQVLWREENELKDQHRHTH